MTDWSREMAKPLLTASVQQLTEIAVKLFYSVDTYLQITWTGHTNITSKQWQRLVSAHCDTLGQPSLAHEYVTFNGPMFRTQDHGSE